MSWEQKEYFRWDNRWPSGHRQVSTGARAVEGKGHLSSWKQRPHCMDSKTPRALAGPPSTSGAPQGGGSLIRASLYMPKQSLDATAGYLEGQLTKARSLYLSDDGSLDGPDLVTPGASGFLGVFQTSCFLGEWREGILVGWRVALLF